LDVAARGPAPLVRQQLVVGACHRAHAVDGVSVRSGRGGREGGSVEVGGWDVDILADT
jgi:hypothetical protein